MQCFRDEKFQKIVYDYIMNDMLPNARNGIEHIHLGFFLRKRIVLIEPVSRSSSLVSSASQVQFPKPPSAMRHRDDRIFLSERRTIELSPEGGHRKFFVKLSKPQAEDIIRVIQLYSL